MSKTGNKLIIKAEVPGIDKKDIGINLAHGLLTIMGEKRHEKKEECENYFCDDAKPKKNEVHYSSLLIRCVLGLCPAHPLSHPNSFPVFYGDLIIPASSSALVF